MQKTGLILTLAIAAIASVAQAQVYQCVKDGKASFQDRPCESGSVSKTLSAGSGADANAKLPWEGLRAGMSVDDVMRAIPDARRAEGDSLTSGAKKLLQRKAVRIAGTVADASYFFNGGRFVQVNLSDSNMNSNEDSLSGYNKIAAAFRAKYGKEITSKVSNEKWGLSADANWMVDGGKLWVTVIPVTRDTSMLTFGYKPSDGTH